LYLSHEVETHEKVLQKVAALAGHTRNAELKTIVAGARPILQAHLKAAQTLMEEAVMTIAPTKRFEQSGVVLTP